MKRLFIATLLLMMMIAATCLAAGWEQIYTDDNDNVIYFDPARVSIASHMGENATFSAPFRMDYSDKGRQALINWYRDYSIMPAGIENLSYDVTTIQFKKEGDKRYYYISERVSYNSYGSQISGMHYTNTAPAWQEIPVASVVDVEYYNALLIVEGKDFN